MRSSLSEYLDVSGYLVLFEEQGLYLPPANLLDSRQGGCLPWRRRPQNEDRQTLARCGECSLNRGRDPVRETSQLHLKNCSCMTTKDFYESSLPPCHFLTLCPFNYWILAFGSTRAESDCIGGDTCQTGRWGP